MNKFDLDHPMYVHSVMEPPAFAVPTRAKLREAYPASADLFEAAAREILETEHYPQATWSISNETLDTMRRFAPDFKLFVEIGTFIGHGVLAIREYCDTNDIRCPILTVDTYAGTLLIGAIA